MPFFMICSNVFYNRRVVLCLVVVAVVVLSAGIAHTHI
jgi:hypothetical protein